MSVAVGVVGSLLDSEAVLRGLRGIASSGYSLVFFHSLRVFAKTHRAGTSARLRLEDYLETVGARMLEWDAEGFLRRLRRFVEEAIPPSYTGVVKVVLHTEYVAPLWFSDTFRSMYATTVRAIVKEVGNALKGYRYVVSVEVHPGFTDLENCTVNIYTGNVVVTCVRAERDPVKLATFLADFAKKVGGRVRLCVEPRAGSIVRVRGVPQPQTLDNHFVASRFARSTGMGLVLDPGQVGNRSSVDDVWDELHAVGTHHADIVEEVHVHSVVAQFSSGRYHAPPRKDELNRYARLAKLILQRKRRDPLGLIYEVIGDTNAVESLRVLASMLRGAQYNTRTRVRT